MIRMIIVINFIALLNIRVKPRVLLMPVKVDIDVSKLKEILMDPFFSKLKAVGINGGEITLMKNVDEIVSTVLLLKNIEYIHFISNGL